MKSNSRFQKGYSFIVNVIFVYVASQVNVTPKKWEDLIYEFANQFLNAHFSVSKKLWNSSEKGFAFEIPPKTQLFLLTFDHLTRAAEYSRKN